MELRTVKMFSNGMFKGMRSSDTGGLDVNNVLNSMFKDYSYKLKGELQGSDEKLLMKIPLKKIQLSTQSMCLLLQT